MQPCTTGIFPTYASQCDPCHKSIALATTVRAGQQPIRLNIFTIMMFQVWRCMMGNL